MNDLQFENPLDVLAAFETVGIEHLEVSDERTVVIYKALLNPLAAMWFHITERSSRFGRNQFVEQFSEMSIVKNFNKAAQKQDDSDAELTIQILEDGEVVAEKSTAEYGVMSVKFF